VAEVVEDSPAGMFVAHVSVTDADSGKNGRVNCSLEGGGTAFRLVQNYNTEYQARLTFELLTYSRLGIFARRSYDYYTRLTVSFPVQPG